MFFLNMEILGSIGIRFKLLGQMLQIKLHAAKGDINAYASLGGMLLRYAVIFTEHFVLAWKCLQYIYKMSVSFT
jgi:hypothetical protein